MSDKSYVSLEQKVCPICGTVFDTGAILLDRRIKDSMEHHTLTGVALCPEHEARFKEGYVALVAVDPAKSGGDREKYTPETAYRTGAIVHVRFRAFPKIFNIELPRDPEGNPLPFMYCEEGVVEKLRIIQAEAEGR